MRCKLIEVLCVTLSVLQINTMLPEVTGNQLITGMLQVDYTIFCGKL